MAVAYSGVGTLVGNIGANSVAWPTHATGNLGLIFIESCGGEPVAQIAGWQTIAASPQASGAGTAGTQLTIYWRIATSAAEANVSIADAGDHTIAAILVFTGTDVNTPVQASAGGAATVGTARTFPAVVTAVANEMIVMVITADLDATTAFATWGANATLGTITERGDTGATAGNGGEIAVATAVMASAGNTGTTGVTVTSSVSAYITLALQPPISVAAGPGARRQRTAHRFSTMR